MLGISARVSTRAAKAVITKAIRAGSSVPEAKKVKRALNKLENGIILGDGQAIREATVIIRESARKAGQNLDNITREVNRKSDSIAGLAKTSKPNVTPDLKRNLIQQNRIVSGIANAIKSIKGRPSKPQILDLGAGDRPLKNATHAIDAQSKSDLLDLRGGKKFRRGLDFVFDSDFTDKLPFADSQFDKIASNFAIDTFGTQRTFNEAARILREGGEFVVTTGDRARFERVVKALNRAGFGKIKVKRIDPSKDLTKPGKDGLVTFKGFKTLKEAESGIEFIPSFSNHQIIKQGPNKFIIKAKPSRDFLDALAGDFQITAIKGAPKTGKIQKFIFGQRGSLGDLTDDAEKFIEAADSGGIPAFISKNLRRIANDNDVAITKSMTPNDVIAALKAKKAQIKKAKAEAKKSDEKPDTKIERNGGGDKPVDRPKTRPRSGNGNGSGTASKEQFDKSSGVAVAAAAGEARKAASLREILETTRPLRPRRLRPKRTPSKAKERKPITKRKPAAAPKTGASPKAATKPADAPKTAAQPKAAALPRTQPQTAPATATAPKPAEAAPRAEPATGVRTRPALGTGTRTGTGERTIPEGAVIPKVDTVNGTAAPPKVPPKISKAIAPITDDDPITDDKDFNFKLKRGQFAKKVVFRLGAFFVTQDLVTGERIFVRTRPPKARRGSTPKQTFAVIELSTRRPTQRTFDQGNVRIRVSGAGVRFTGI